MRFLVIAAAQLALCCSGCGFFLDADGPLLARDSGGPHDADAGTCGDGIVSGSEQCDDGNASDGDGCDADCTASCEVDADCDALTTPCLAFVCDEGRGACREVPRDQDGDGYVNGNSGCGGDDCDDSNPDVNPGQGDACNMVDDDCDGMVDEDDPPLQCFTDRDGDGHTDLPGVAFCFVEACPAGFDARGIGDCWDADPSVFPRAGLVNNDQDQFFEEPTGRPDAEHPFDYDCSGYDEVEFYNHECPPSGDMDCTPSAGFEGDEPPACGTSAPFVSCAPGSSGGCQRSSSLTRVQRCR